MRVPLRRHTQSRSLSCRGIRLPDRSNAPVVGRHQTAGQERLFAATIGTTGFHRTGHPPLKNRRRPGLLDLLSS